MLGDAIAVNLLNLRMHVESLMVDVVSVSRLGVQGWSKVGEFPARRVKSGGEPVLPAAASGEAFTLEHVNVPHDADVRVGDMLEVAGGRVLVSGARRHTHMVELRLGGVWPAAPVTVNVVRPGPKDSRGNPVPGTESRFTVEDAAVFAQTSSDPTDLSQVVKTTMRVWCPPGVMLMSGDELFPQSPAFPYRYIVKGDPAFSPLGVVAELQRGKVMGSA